MSKIISDGDWYFTKVEHTCMCKIFSSAWMKKNEGTPLAVNRWDSPLHFVGLDFYFRVEEKFLM